MPSPFPGMDPWLEDEGIFPDLHDSLLIAIRNALNATLPPTYRAAFKHRVWVDDVQRRDPDVSVFGPDEPSGDGGLVHSTLPGLTVIEQPETWEDTYLEIVSAAGDRLVTAVEILSRSNKQSGSKGREAYEEKQSEYRHGGVNVVEIDLLRGGGHVTMIDREDLEQLTPDYSYHVAATIRRGRLQRFATAWRLSDRLPAFGIPLDPKVAPAMIDLQPMMDAAYEQGRYAMPAEYHLPPDPPLTAEQQAWADGILKAKGVPNA